MSGARRANWRTYAEALVADCREDLAAETIAAENRRLSAESDMWKRIETLERELNGAWWALYGTAAILAVLIVAAVRR